MRKWKNSDGNKKHVRPIQGNLGLSQLYCVDCSVETKRLVPLVVSFISRGFNLTENSYYCERCGHSYCPDEKNPPTKEYLQTYCLAIASQYYGLYKDFGGEE